MLIAALRLARFALHLPAGFAAALALGRLPPRARDALVVWWARGLLDALGVRLRVEGAVPRGAGMLVANHVSWLDVLAIAAVRPAAFVCKSEIAAWPGIGWLLARIGTVFIRRRSFRDVWRVNQELRRNLGARRSVAAFPEGTTTRGDEVLAFRSALFQPAVDFGLPVYPIALAYSGAEAAYVDDQSFLSSLRAILGARRLEVHLAVLAPLDTRGAGRKALAARTRSAIACRAFGLRLELDRRAAARGARRRRGLALAKAGPTGA